MIVIALVLALVGKPMTTWTWLNMLLMLTNVTSNPLEEGIRKLVHKQKLVSKFCNLLQRTNQIGHVKGVSTTHAGKEFDYDKFHGVVKVRDLVPCGYLNIERCHAYMC